MSDEILVHNDPVEVEVKEELAQAKQLSQQFSIEEFKSGEWFFRLILMVKGSYERNARAAYFQQKYPDLSPDEIADKLISVTVRYATIAGGVSGVATSANEIMTISSAGLAWSLFVGSVGAEMVYLARVQMRLILDLAVIYDIQLDPEDPEDVLLVFGYALGVAPADALGQLLQISGRAVTKDAVRKYISKSTLKTVQELGQKIGLKILQRSIIKFAIPVASVAISSSYNYTSTKAIGKVAKNHFKNRGKGNENDLVTVAEDVIPDEEISLDSQKILKGMTKKLKIKFPWKQLETTAKMVKSAGQMVNPPQKEGVKIPVTFEED